MMNILIIPYVLIMQDLRVLGLGGVWVLAPSTFGTLGNLYAITYEFGLVSIGWDAPMGGWVSYKLGCIYTKAIRPQCLRILEFSLLESVACPHFMFTSW